MRILFSACLLLCSVGGWALLSAEPTPLQPQDADPVLVLKITSAIQSQNELKTLSLTIDVVNGAAVIGGEIPSIDLVPKLRETVDRVPGVRHVKITCWEGTENDQYAARVKQLMEGKTPKPLAVPELPRVVVADRRVQTEVTTLRPSVMANIRWLEAPIAPWEGPEFVKLAEAIRNRDARFAGLQLKFEDKLVTISGRAASHEDISDLVAELRKVPGIERVRRGSLVAE
jgi:BON domain